MWKRWIVLALLTAGVVISYIDRTNFSVVLVMKEFQQGFPHYRRGSRAAQLRLLLVVHPAADSGGLDRGPLWNPAPLRARVLSLERSFCRNSMALGRHRRWYSRE